MLEFRSNFPRRPVTVVVEKIGELAEFGTVNHYTPWPPIHDEGPPPQVRYGGPHRPLFVPLVRRHPHQLVDWQWGAVSVFAHQRSYECTTKSGVRHCTHHTLFIGNVNTNTVYRIG
jgi:hypothetical protein